MPACVLIHHGRRECRGGHEEATGTTVADVLQRTEDRTDGNGDQGENALQKQRLFVPPRNL